VNMSGVVLRNFTLALASVLDAAARSLQLDGSFVTLGGRG